MGIKVFGAIPNRTHRVLWLLEEGGLDHEIEQLNTSEEIAGSEELARYNPNRKVPTVVVDDVAVWDSLAINLFLSERFGVLEPEGPAGRAHAVQWSIWAQAELDGRIITITKARFGDEADRDAVLADETEKDLQKPLAALERGLADRDYLTGRSFSVTDLNIASVMVFAPPIGVDLSGFPAVDAWLRRCLERPVAKDVFQRAFAELLGTS